MSVDILAFTVSGRPFALRVTQVREVLRAASLTDAPPSTPPLEGILNLRGDSVAVLDVRAMLRLPPISIHPDQYFIILECPAQRCAIRVDGTVVLHQVDENVIRPSEEISGSGIAIREIVSLEAAVIFLLDTADFSPRSEMARNADA